MLFASDYQTIMRTWFTLIYFHSILAHKNINGNKQADVPAKVPTGWKREKKKNKNWKEQDSDWTTEKRVINRARTIIELASEETNLELWKVFCSNKKTSREPYAICFKRIKKTLQIHYKLCQTPIFLIVWMRTEKIGLLKFLHFISSKSTKSR